MPVEEKFCIQIRIIRIIAPTHEELVGPSVDLISCDRSSKKLQMHADLMLPTGLDPNLEIGELDSVETSVCKTSHMGAGIEWSTHHTNGQTVSCGETERNFDGFGLADLPRSARVLRQCSIEFPRCFSGKHLSQYRDVLGRSRTHQNTTGFTVDAMSRLGAVIPMPRKIALYGIQSGMRRLVHEHSRRFIDDDERFVFVKDVDLVILDVLGRQMFAHDDHITVSQARASLDLAWWFDFDVAMFGDLTRTTARETPHAAREELIEPPAIKILVDFESALSDIRLVELHSNRAVKCSDEGPTPSE